MMFLLINIALIVSFLSSSHDAFTPSCALRHHGMEVRNSKWAHDVDEIVVGMKNSKVKEFLLCTAAAIVVTVTPVLPVSASSYNDINRLPSIQIADNVKELDFSLPSYEDIKSYKASAENAKSLTVQPKPFDPKSISLRTSSSLIQTTSEELTATTANDDTASAPTSSSNPLSSILPSMSKKGPKQKTSYDGYTF